MNIRLSAVTYLSVSDTLRIKGVTVVWIPKVIGESLSEFFSRTGELGPGGLHLSGDLSGVVEVQPKALKELASKYSAVTGVKELFGLVHEHIRKGFKVSLGYADSGWGLVFHTAKSKDTLTKYSDA